MDGLFQALRPFVWPRYREEGPPEFVQGLLLGRDFLGEESDLSTSSMSVLEIMTLGYRPVTSLAILRILSESTGVAMHGMQIGRELEKRFAVQEGWFTKTRYYTDRVGKLLTLLNRLEMIREVVRKDLRGGRSFAAYQINPAATGSIKDTVARLSKGERISLFSSSLREAQPSVSISMAGNQKECTECGVFVNSPSARYCERCGKPLKVGCEKCGTRVEAIHDFCLSCGYKIS